jgi:hypothetical protein
MNTTATSLSTAVSAAVGVICLVAALLFWKVGQKHTPRLTALLVLTGFAGFMATPAGGWIRSAITWCNNLLGTIAAQLFGAARVNALVIGLITAGTALYILAIHFKHKSIDGTTFGAAAITPFTVAAIPGPVGAAAVSVVTAVTSAIGYGVASMFGIH